MDYILPNEVEMEKMAEEYAKIKILRPTHRNAIVETMSVPEEEGSAEKASAGNARAAALPRKSWCFYARFKIFVPKKRPRRKSNASFLTKNRRRKTYFRTISTAKFPKTRRLAQNPSPIFSSEKIYFLSK